MLRIQDASDWMGARTRLTTNLPQLADAAYCQALKMDLEPQVTRGTNGFRAIEFVGSDAETSELLAELPSGLLEAARVAPQRTVTRPRRLSRAQEWQKAEALLGGAAHA